MASTKADNVPFACASSSKPEKAGPFVKWAGGKAQLWPQLSRLLPPDAAARRYHEPFLGGGALFFALAPAGAATLSDVNADLIGLYRAVKQDVEGLLAALARLDGPPDPDRYYAIRARFNAERDLLPPLERAALFLYLNKRGYNGLWRVNSRGHHNVPAGRYENRSLYGADVLRADSAALARADLTVAPFESVLARALPGDFFYFDPPYHPVSETADFTAYARGGFGPADQERLAQVFAELDRRGCAVMLSNSDCAFVRSLYAAFRVDEVTARRRINRNASGRGPVSELVVRNY